MTTQTTDPQHETIEPAPTVQSRLNGNDITSLRAAQWLSYALHPFLIPLYAVVILMFGTPLMSGIPLKLKLYFVSMVTVNAVIIPALVVLLLNKLGYLADLSLRTRSQRIVPIVVMAISYGMCLYLLPEAVVSFMLRKFVIAALVCVLLAFVINIYWKISLHMIALGGLTAMLVLMSISGFGAHLALVAVALLLSGALASARLYLGSHNVLQVVAGYLLGLAVMTLVMVII